MTQIRAQKIKNKRLYLNQHQNRKKIKKKNEKKQTFTHGPLTSHEVKALSEEEKNKIIDSNSDYKATLSLLIFDEYKCSKKQVDRLFDEGVIYLNELIRHQTLSDEQIYDVLNSVKRRTFLEDLFKYQKLNKEQINYVLDNWEIYRFVSQAFFENQIIDDIETQKKALSKSDTTYSMLYNQTLSKEIIDTFISNYSYIDAILEDQN